MIIILIEILLIISYKTNETLIYVINYVGTFFNIFEYLPMGFNLKFLIKNKISEKYTLFGAFFGLINTIIWLLWAINTGDKLHSLIANIFGVILCLIQFLIFFIFRKDEKQSKDYTKINENSDNINNSTPEIKDNNLQNNNNNIDNNNFNNNIKKGGPSDIIEDFI